MDDLAGHSLHVRGTLHQDEDGHFAIGTTKTAKGHRRVPAAQDALDVLAQHRARQADERAHIGVAAWRHPEQMFQSEIGTYLDVAHVRRTWKRCQKQANVPAARLHDTRHLNVSLLIRQGMDALTIADRIGHSNPAFTIKKYAHLLDEQRERAALSLSELLGPMPAPKQQLPEEPDSAQEPSNARTES